jgi:hypothetical protein
LGHFRQLVENGVTKCDQIATEMTLSPATVCRLAQKAIAAGWLKTTKRQYILTQERGTEPRHASGDFCEAPVNISPKRRCVKTLNRPFPWNEAA